MEKPDAKHILVTGGIRSGKSNWAQKYLSGFTDVGYIATARWWDDEMGRRIDRHRASRPARWTTYEAYRDLDRVVEAGSEQALLLDCLSNLVTNWMMDAHQDYDRVPLEEIGLLEQQIREDVSRFLTACRRRGTALVIVTNECGSGLVAPYRLGRLFTDILGRLNQMLAEEADEVYLMSCGLPLRLK